MYSQHFSDAELSCHCKHPHPDGENKVTPSLISALESFRLLIKKPVIVDDAYRCSLHNKEVGGALHSQHLLGNAADIRVDGFSANELYLIAATIPGIHGFGRDDFKNYLHIDTRPAPTAKWCYGKNGKEIPWYDFHSS